MSTRIETLIAWTRRVVSDAMPFWLLLCTLFGSLFCYLLCLETAHWNAEHGSREQCCHNSVGSHSPPSISPKAHFLLFEIEDATYASEEAFPNNPDAPHAVSCNFSRERCQYALLSPHPNAYSLLTPRVIAVVSDSHPGLHHRANTVSATSLEAPQAEFTSRSACVVHPFTPLEGGE